MNRSSHCSRTGPTSRKNRSVAFPKTKIAANTPDSTFAGFSPFFAVFGQNRPFSGIFGSFWASRPAVLAWTWVVRRNSFSGATEPTSARAGQIFSPITRHVLAENFRLFFGIFRKFSKIRRSSCPALSRKGPAREVAPFHNRTLNLRYKRYSFCTLLV